MPNYPSFPSYNSYPQYPQNSYQQQYSQAMQPQYQQPAMSYAQPQQARVGIEWVDGEVGAKAFQLPAGWPANAPMPLWDTNDTVIYLKSINQMGMPNPLQKVRYTMEEQPRMSAAMSSQAALPAGDMNQTAQPMPDMSEYVRKDELNQMKEELKAAITSVGTNNASETKGAKVNAKSSV